ncbi:hypothetical protein ACH4SK_43890 [Streptomyces inhibens]|uniref:hypothetical protein n=1 Tax=Streptomyces inhibens TaxID=2293571 RepID=UPI0037B8C545
MTHDSDHEAIFALLAAAVPDDLVVPVLDRLAATSLLGTARPYPGFVGPVVAHGTPEHLAALAANPALTRAQLRALAEELSARAADPAAGAGSPERFHLSIAAELAYVHRRATPRLRHHLANGPLGEELAERLHNARRIDYVRPLAVSGDPRVLLRILTAPGDRVTEAEQADAALRLLSAGQADRVVELLGRPGTTTPRRRVRRELRRLLGEYGTLPAGACDPRAAVLVRMARRPDSQGGLTGLLRDRPHDPHLVLSAPVRRDPADLVRRQLRRPLPVPVRSWMLLWDDLEPDVARAFLHHGPSPDPAPHDAHHIAALAVRIGPLSLDDVVRATAPVRLLPGLITAKGVGRVIPATNDPQLRDAGSNWLKHERSSMLRTVDTLLADAPPRGLIAAAETRPGSPPGTLPELLCAEPSGIGVDAELLHWLLTRAPATAVPDVIRALRPDDALSLAAVAIRRDTPVILGAVLTLRTDPPVHDRLLATALDAARDVHAARHRAPKAAVETLVEEGKLLWIGEPTLLTRLVRADVPGVYAYVMRHGGFHEHSDGTVEGLDDRLEPFVRDFLDEHGPDAVNPDTVTRIFDSRCLPSAEPPKGPSTPTKLRVAGHGSQAPRTPVDWAAVTARYRDGVAGEPRDAWVIAHHPELPEELAPLLLDAHPELFSSHHPDTRWKPVLVRAVLPRLRRQHNPQYWVGVHLAHGTLNAADLLRHGTPACHALPRPGVKWHRQAVLPDKPLADEVRRRLGSLTDDREMWAVAARLLPAFSGTLAELLDTAVAIIRT